MITEMRKRLPQNHRYDSSWVNVRVEPACLLVLFCLVFVLIVFLYISMTRYFSIRTNHPHPSPATRSQVIVTMLAAILPVRDMTDIMNFIIFYM